MSAELPLVSIVMATCNDADRVGRAAASVLAQTFTKLELIVINDGSRDGTAAVLDAIAASDPRVRVVHQENTGLTRALILGCALARGQFVARQDSDDWSHELRIAEQVSLLQREDKVGFVSCRTAFVGPEDEPLAELARPLDPEEATRRLLANREGPPAHGSVMFRKSLYDEVGGYRPEFLFSQDSDLWLRMATKAWIGYLPECRYYHRKEISGTSGARRLEQARFAQLAHRCRAAREQGLDESPVLAEAAALARQISSAGHSPLSGAGEGEVSAAYQLGSQLARNRDARARKYLWPVVRRSPGHWKAWIRLLQSLLTARSGVAGGDRR